MRRSLGATLCLVVAAIALADFPAQAAYHLWDIKEIFTNQDGTVQFIELQAPATGANGENSLFGHTLKATSTVAGVPAVVTFSFPSNDPVGFTNGKSLLIATPSFESLPGAVTPDYNTLPANFFNANASILSFNYAEGSDTVTFAGGVIPQDGLHSVSDANLFDIANFVSGINSPTNFATLSGSINLSTTSPNGDYNGDLVVNAADYTVWRNTLGQSVANLGEGADGDADGMVDDGDYDFWKQQFGTVVSPGAGAIEVQLVPEPATLGILISGLLTHWGLAAWRRRRRNC